MVKRGNTILLGGSQAWSGRIFLYPEGFWFRDEPVHQAIGAPAGRHPVVILPIGYAAEALERTPRLAACEFIHRL